MKKEEMLKVSEEIEDEKDLYIEELFNQLVALQQVIDRMEHNEWAVAVKINGGKWEELKSSEDLALAYVDEIDIKQGRYIRMITENSI